MALEREGVLDRLSQYDVLVVPEYAYFEEDTWKEPVRAFAQRGGRLVVTGRQGGRVHQGAARRSAVAKVSYVANFTGAMSEARLTLPEAYTDALTGAGAYTQFCFTSPMEDLSATVRQNGSDLYLHIIRRGNRGTGKYGRLLHIYTAGGLRNRLVRAECPYLETPADGIEWSRDDKGVVTAQSEAFDTYLLVTLKPSRIAGLG